jgi:hypothetical protein
MLVLTEDALLVCAHVLGEVGLAPQQSWVTVNGRRALVETDPENRPISRCPMIGVTIKPCQLTLRVEQGYSDFIRIDGKRLCLDTVRGKTDGTPPGVVQYFVRAPGQDFVSGAG